MATLEPKNRAPDPSVEKAGTIQQLKDFLRPYVSRMRSSIPSRKAGPSWARSLAVLDHYGLRPATVFDIGVAYGTYELYRAFPDAHYHLIDPTRGRCTTCACWRGGCAATSMPWRWAIMTATR